MTGCVVVLSVWAFAFAAPNVQFYAIFHGVFGWLFWAAMAPHSLGRALSGARPRLWLAPVERR